MKISLTETIKIFGKKHGKIIFIVIFIISNFANYYVTKGTTTNINNNLSCPSPVLSLETESVEGKCPQGDYEKFLVNWDTGNYKIQKEEQTLCANTLSNFLSPAIWFKSSISTSFDSIKFSYFPKVINGKNSPLLLLIGKDPKIAKLYLQENNQQLVGFEKVNIENSEFPLVRQPPMILEDPPQEGVKIDLTLRSKVVKENEVEFTLNIEYISKLTSKPKENVFEFQVDLPEVNPLGKESKIEFGIATLKGMCFKPSNYEVCE